MLSSLTIRNFRGLEDLNVPHLGRVNLIVGKNNSGKSSILEALRIYAQQASQTLLDELVAAHDETLRTQMSATADEDEQVPYENFFTGRRFPTSKDGAIYIGDKEGREYLKISHSYYQEERSVDSLGFSTVRRIPMAKNELDDEEANQALLVSSAKRDQPKWLGISDSPRRGRAPNPDPLALPVGYVPTSILPSSSLADLWDSIALTNYDDVVRAGLRIIEPRVEGVAFVKRDNPRSRFEGERTAIIKLQGSDRPVTLNSMGDGMVRVLQLLLLLVPAKGGLYLVDEFENGLHYSVQEKVWEMIFELAKTTNIQVFATTHSWDCIEAFKNVAARSDEPAILFRVGKSIKTSEKGKVIATAFDKAALAQITQLEAEVR
jgi:predicted ATPase